MLILSLAIAVAVSIGQLAKLIPTYATEMNGYVADIGDGLTNLGVGSDQSDAMVSSADVGQAGRPGDVDPRRACLDTADRACSSSSRCWLFLAFDSAKTARLADGARRHRPYLVDAWPRSREAPAATSASRPSSA